VNYEWSFAEFLKRVKLGYEGKKCVNAILWTVNVCPRAEVELVNNSALTLYKTIPITMSYQQR